MPSGSSAVAPSIMSPTIWWPGMTCLKPRRKFAFDDVQIGAADAAGANLQKHVPGLNRRRVRLRFAVVSSRCLEEC